MLLFLAPARLAINVAQGAHGKVLVRVGYGHLAGFDGMLVLVVGTFRMIQHPTIGTQPFYDVPATHHYLYTLYTLSQSGISKFIAKTTVMSCAQPSGMAGLSVRCSRVPSEWFSFPFDHLQPEE
jgi:hypothetical protein